MHISRGIFCSTVSDHEGVSTLGHLLEGKKKTQIIETCHSTTESKFHICRVLEIIVSRLSCLYPLSWFLWVFLFISVTWKNPLDINAINYCHMYWKHYQRKKAKNRNGKHHSNFYFLRVSYLLAIHTKTLLNKLSNKNLIKFLETF